MTGKHANAKRHLIAKCMILTFLLVSVSTGGPGPYRVFLMGALKNNTDRSGFNDLGVSLSSLLSNCDDFKLIHAPMLIVDSIPGEKILLEARRTKASHILWGSLDRLHHGFNITLKIMEMERGAVAHIQVLVGNDENKEAIAELIRSKLMMWLRRTTMSQLIITTKPSAVCVVLDGKNVGTTPFEGMVQPGTFQLELNKKDYVPVRMPVSFISGNTYQYDLTLSQFVKEPDNGHIIRLLAAATACCGAGIFSHYKYKSAYNRYRDARPPANFDRLYKGATAWRAAEYGFFSLSGAALGVILVKAVF